MVITADEEDESQTDEGLEEVANPIIEVDDSDDQQNSLINLPDEVLGGLQIEIGTPVAVSRPSAAAVAGEKGTAQTNPNAQAFVGPGGIAIAMPSAQSAVGSQGVAVSQPIAASSAGLGGVAIAGGTSVASAGLENSVHKLIVSWEYNISNYQTFY